MAGLLTYSDFFGLPVLVMNSGFGNEKIFYELTAAGQLQIYTVFPFNPAGEAETKSAANVTKK